MEPSRRKRFERSEPEHPLTPMKLRLLLVVAECGLLTVPQLAGLSDMTLKAVRNHMADLFHLGLVDRIGIPAVALSDIDAPNTNHLLFGSAPIIYKLSKDGTKAVLSAGLLAKEQIAEVLDYGPKNDLFLAHELQVRDVRVWLEVAARKHGLQGLETWVDGKGAAIGRARPDAWFAFPLKGATFLGLVEVDRGTERRPSTWAEKFDGYRAILGTEEMKAVTGHKTGRVLVIAPNAARREVIAAILADCLAETNLGPERFMLVERKALEGADLRSSIWQIPTVAERVPFVLEKYL